MAKPHIKPREPDRETQEEAAERHQAAQEVRTARWGRVRPLLYASASTEALQGSQTLAVGWLDTSELHLILAGPVGTGKTHTAMALGNQAAERGMLVHYCTVSELVASTRPGWQGTPHRALAVDADLLILDDLGASNDTDWGIEQLTSVIDQRVNNLRRTIVTTNMKGDALAEVWGARLVDRLLYRSLSVTIAGESRRRSGV